MKLRALALAIICFGLGQAVQSGNGTLNPQSIRWLAAVFVLGVSLLFFRREWRANAWASAALPVVLGAGVAYQFTVLFTAMPGMYLRLGNLQALWPFFEGLAVAAVAVGAGFATTPWVRRLQPVIVLLAFAYGARWVLEKSPEPHIDVFYFQRDGAAALLKGINPYSLRGADIYGGNSAFYGPGLSVNGVLQFGFLYPPMSLLLALPAHALAGDFRWAQLLAMLFTAGVIMYLRPTPVGRLVAALFLFTPRAFFVLEQAWTEPLVLLMVSLTVLVAEKKPAWLPWVFGLLVAVKQYSIFMLPLALLLLPREQWRLKPLAAFFGRAAISFTVVTLPFLLWGPADFWLAVVKLQVLQPFRVESLSFLAWWHQQHGEQLSVVWSFLLAGGLVAISLWRLPRGPASFLTALSVVLLAFFATNKQAFCNYYYLVIGLAALASAFSSEPGEAGERSDVALG